MKICGFEKIQPRQRMVTIGLGGDEEVPVQIILSAPKLNELDQMNKDMPFPEAPIGKGIERDPKTNMPVRGQDGQYVGIRDLDDPQYLKRVEETQRARTVAVMLMCIEAGKEGQIDVSDIKKNGDAVAYYLEIWQAMEVMGLDLAALRVLDEAATELMKISPEELHAAHAQLGGGVSGERGR